jgi:hypothetical protein
MDFKKFIADSQMGRTIRYVQRDSLTSARRRI